MAEPKPIIPTYLVAGKAVGSQTHVGFVDTFNWMLSWIENFHCGRGIVYHGAEWGRPFIGLNIAGGEPPIDDPSRGNDVVPYDAGVEGGGVPAIPGPFEPVYTNGVISGCANCVFCAGREFVDYGTLTVSATSASSGYVLLTVSHPSSANVTFGQASTASLSVDLFLPTNLASNTQTQIPLYHITNGVVDVDLRAVPTGVLAQ